VLGTRELEDVAYDDHFWFSLEREFEAEVQRIFLVMYLTGIRLGREMLGQKALQVDLWGPDIDSLEEAMVRTVRGYTNEWFRQIGAARRKAIRDAVLEARAGGLGPKFVAEKISRFFSAEAARSIAVTETTRLLGLGAQAQYRKMGLLQWQWNTSNDGKVCTLCGPLEGVVFPIAQAFDPQHVSCRCWPSPVGMDELELNI
jgi:SPP1 gp7 family putative phage head morphogenesis protein